MKNNTSISDKIKCLLQLSTKLAVFGFALFMFTGIVNAQTNLAKGKTTRQSSTRSAGGSASRAIDGNTSGVFTNNSVTHTASETENGAWWEVDLGAVYWINSIKVFNRVDCCKDRLKNTRIAVSAVPFASNSSGIKYGDIVNQAAISNGQPLIFYGTRQVRYVRIYKTGRGVLSLAEVEVYGKKIEAKTSSSTNIGNKTGTVKNLTGNWAGYVKDGTKSAYLWKISQTGSTLSIKEINTSQNLASNGRISGNQVSATDFGTSGTLSADGNRINWANGESWRKESSTSGTSSANNQSSTSTASTNSKLTNGSWDVYTAQGKLVTSYKYIISRSSGKTYINVGKTRREASIQGNRISLSGLNVTGTITDNGNRIAWSDKTIWAIPGYSGLQNSNSNTNSNTSSTRNNGNAGTPATANSTSTSSNDTKLTVGLWNVYTSQGDLITSYKTTIARAGGKTFVQLGTYRREANIQGNTISVPGLNTTGIITDNGNRIAWGNKTIWAKPGFSRLQNSNSNTNSNTPITRNDGNVATTPNINTETKVEPKAENTEIESKEDDENDLMAAFDKSKQLPSSIATYLNTQFKGWEISPESELCGEKKLFEKGDFDGDGKIDYAVYFVVNKNSTNARQILYTFLNKGAYYQPFKISEEKDLKNFKFSSFAIVKKGETLQTGEGKNDVIILNVDAITEYTCETDASATYIFGDGKFSHLDLYSP